MPASDLEAEGAPSLEKDVSSRLFCCSPVRRWIPLPIRQEVYHILRMVIPLLGCRTLTYFLPIVVTMFVGRLGNTALAGYAMACAFSNVTSAATGIGLCLASDTLISQTFGARNLLRVGVILQRCIIILMVHTLLCWALLVNTRPILLLLGQEPEVARIAEIYVMAYLPAVPAVFVHQLLASYLQCQRILPPMAYSAIMSNLANVLTNYALVSWLDLGILGSAAANSLSMIYHMLFLFLYIWLRKLHVNTWGGWSMDSLQEWGSFMKLAIPSLFMCCFEWWIYEIGGFLAGMLSEVDLGAQHIVVTLSYINYMIPSAAHGVACIRVGNALGAGDTAGGLRTSKVVLVTTAVFTLLQCAILAAIKSVIGYLFTSDHTIAALVSKLFNAFSVMQFFSSLMCVSMGILMGLGQQKIVAGAYFVGYYFIGLPILVALMFGAELGSLGYWLGMLISNLLLAVTLMSVIFKLDWKKMTKEAVIRAGKATCVEFKTSLSEPEPDPLISGSKFEPEDGHGSSSHQTQEGVSSSEIQQQQQQQQEPVALLSSSQLLLRRGLTTLTALITLGVGIAIHLLLPLPESSWKAGVNATMEDGNWTTASPLEQSTVLI